MSAPESQVMTAPAPVAARRARFDIRRDGWRLAAGLLVVLLLDLVVWMWVVRPVREDLAVLAERKITADTVEKHEAKSLEQLRAIHTHVGEVQKGIDTFYNDMLATKRDRLVPFQSALVHVGRDFNVMPEKVSVGSDELRDEGLDAIAFTFPLTGGYENLRNFLARLEDLDQFVIVREVGLTGSKEGGRALQLNVSVETYFNAPDLHAERAAPGKRVGERPRPRSMGRR